MSVLLSLLLVWFGAAEPVAVANELEDMAFEQLVDPVERWRPLVEQHFPPEEVEIGLCVIRNESGGDPGAENPRSSAAGLFQILSSLWSDHYGVSYDRLLDPEVNTRVARSIWDKSGWLAWSAYRRCDHLPRIAPAEPVEVDVCTHSQIELDEACIS